MPTQVARKLFRLLLRVRSEYRHAQIPLVGVVGFNGSPPALDVRPQLFAAFRDRQGVSDAAELARRSSEGFRALRQAQQQLSVLQGSEEETRQALRAWFYLCDAWSHRLQQDVQGPDGSSSSSSSATQQHIDLTRAAAAPTGRSPAAGGAAAAASSSVPGLAALPLQLRQLAAALEEGSLLVERLYDANHLSLEFGDDEEELAAEKQAGAGGSAAPGQEAAVATAEGSEAPVPSAAHLPAALLAPVAQAARRRLDGLAAAVAAAHPGLFPAAAPAGSSGRSSVSGGGADCSGCALEANGGEPESLLRRQLAAVSHTLFHELKFRHEPVEWVYDGLAPALLPQVLTRRRGVPLSLAVVYSAVCRRLGLAAAPVKAGSGGAPGVAEGPASLHGLPPDVAARQAGRTVALAPSPDCWLVAAVGSGSGSAAQPAAAAAQPSDGAEAAAAKAAGAGSGSAPGPGQELRHGQRLGLEVVLVDVDRRGRLMTPGEAAARFPDLHTASSTQQQQQAQRSAAHEPPAQPLQQAEAALLLPLLAGAAGCGPLPLWGELARLVLTAHTRRGESDLVALWLVQVLALDHRAAEWAVMAPPA